MSKFRVTLLAVAGVLIATGWLWLAAPAVDFEPTTLFGTVLRVPDGDTIVLEDEARQEHTVRLEGISAPEPKQRFGDKATEALADLVTDKKVRVEWTKKDPYGRIVGDVYLPNGASEGDESVDLWVNRKLIEDGCAWHFAAFDHRQSLAQAEVQARAEKKGLWDDPQPEAPWDFRKRDRKPKKRISGNQ